MPYVMVPVPSEHVLDLMRWLQFRTEPEESRADDEASLRRMVEESDDVTRALLLLVTKGAIEGTPLLLSDAADDIGEDPGAVRSMLLDAGRRSLGEDRTLVKVLTEPAVNEHGRSGRFSYLTMRPHHARVVRAAARGVRTPGP